MENNQLKKPTLIKDLGMLYPNKKSKQKRRYGNFLCKCNNNFKAQVHLVKQGNIKSCGCLNKEEIIRRSTTHGLSKHPLHSRWVDMKKRCNNPNNQAYKNYGGRGIKVCKEWINNFEAFYKWSILNGYKDALTIDRIDNDKGYSPDNCRFTDYFTQGSNKRLLQTNNTSGYRGVTKRRESYKWRTQIRVNGKIIQLGNFECRLRGAYAYDSYVEDHDLEHPRNFA